MVSVTRVMPELGALIKLDIIQVNPWLLLQNCHNVLPTGIRNGSNYYFFPSLHQYFLTLFFIIELRLS